MAQSAPTNTEFEKFGLSLIGERSQTQNAFAEHVRAILPQLEQLMDALIECYPRYERSVELFGLTKLETVILNRVAAGDQLTEIAYRLDATKDTNTQNYRRV